MKRSPIFLPALALAALAFPANSLSAQDNSEPATYELRMGAVPNRGIAPNGDQVLVTCNSRGGRCGTFRVHPKGLPMPPSGEFIHTDAVGTVVGEGTWTATELLSFDSYGCGVVTFPDPDVALPPDFCGGVLKLRVLLTPAGTNLAIDAILTVFCIVGPNPPNSHDDPPEEGVSLVVPGAINFNQTNGGMNVFVRQP